VKGTDLAAIVVAIVCTVAATLTLVVLWQVVAALKAVRAQLATIPQALDDLRDAVGRSVEQVERVDHLVGTAEAISARIDSASKVTQAALSAPVIKVASFATGTKAAARRLRRVGSEES
jgi:hypothetical protein